MRNLKLSNIEHQQNILLVFNKLSEIMDDEIYIPFIKYFITKNVSGLFDVLLTYFKIEEKFSKIFDGYTDVEISSIINQLEVEQNRQIILDKLVLDFDIENCFTDFLYSSNVAKERYMALTIEKRVDNTTTKPITVSDGIVVYGLIPKYESRIIKTFVGFCVDYLKIKDTKIKIKYQKINKSTGGFMQSSKDNINWELVIGSGASTEYSLNIIAHELTHIKQSYYNELVVLPRKELRWNVKGEEFVLSIDDYNKLMLILRDDNNRNKKEAFERYVLLPWETEAYANGELIPKLFADSNEYKELVSTSTEPNQKFILENLNI